MYGKTFIMLFLVFFDVKCTNFLESRSFETPKLFYERVLKILSNVSVYSRESAYTWIVSEYVAKLKAKTIILLVHATYRKAKGRHRTSDIDSQ